MQVTEIILISFLVWQVSAMPLPVWLASAFFGVDSDDYNNSPGWAENKFSFKNSKWSLIVFTMELLKGVAAMSILALVSSQEVYLFEVIPFQYVLALIVVLGHTFPIYNEFRRSYSMGTYFGVFASLWFVPATVALGVFVSMWAISKKVSISSLILSCSSLVIVTFIFIDIKALIIAGALSSLPVLSNIKRNLEVVRA